MKQETQGLIGALRVVKAVPRDRAKGARLVAAMVLCLAAFAAAADTVPSPETDDARQKYERAMEQITNGETGKKVFCLLEESAAAGYGPAIAKIKFLDGVLLLKDGDRTDGLRLIQEAAEGGSLSACDYLGGLYRNGKYGVHYDFDAARYWYGRITEDKKGCEHFSYSGCMAMALLQHDSGLLEDRERAAKAFERLAEIGLDKFEDSRACLASARYAFFGLNGKRDVEKAKRFWKMAADRGDETAKGWLEQCEDPAFSDRPLTGYPPEPAQLARALLPHTYLVIDLSGGTNAAHFASHYLREVPKGGWTDEYKTDKLVLRRIPAGTYWMGAKPSDLWADWDEVRHEVTLTKDFYIGVFEVTQAQWEKVVGGTNPSEFKGAMRPVESVSYDRIRGAQDGAHWPASDTVDADSFMGILRRKTGICFDLPTEAQWEYAARAGTDGSVTVGPSFADPAANMITDSVFCPRLATCACYGKHGSVGTSEVGSLLPNDWGLYDTLGNVREWCLDYCTKMLDRASQTDPRGPSAGSDTIHEGSCRTSRGGCWQDIAASCRLSMRFFYGAAQSNSYAGFRVAAAAPELVGLEEFLAEFKRLREVEQFKEAFDYCEKFSEIGYSVANFALGYCYGNGIGTATNRIEALRLYHRAAEGFCVLAYGPLAVCYHCGYGTEKNEEKALFYAELAAKEGDEILLWLAGRYADAGDFDAAVHWWRTAAEWGWEEAKDELEKVNTATKEQIQKMLANVEAGDVAAQFELYRLYSDKLSVHLDLAEAEKWLRRAADSGYAPAERALGMEYWYGGLVERDEATGVGWFKRAAKKGDVCAMTHLGIACAEGWGGMKQDDKAAVGWYLKAVEKGRAAKDEWAGWAAANLAVCSVAGTGMPQDMKQCMEWDRCAAELGNSRGMRNLGACYEEGIGVKQDWDEAFKWYLKAAEHGYKSAQLRVGKAYQDGDLTDRNFAEAVRWYDRAAWNGDQEAAYLLAQLYLYGEGCPRRVADARFLLTQLAVDNYLPAIETLTRFYVQHDDRDKALKLATRAADLLGEAASSRFEGGDCKFLLSSGRMPLLPSVPAASPR